MDKDRRRRLWIVVFVAYLVLLIYFLFFAEEMGRTADMREGYTYNLELFKEIRRFIVYSDILGTRAVVLNIFGNIAAFMPFGILLPMIWKKLDKWYTVLVLSLALSLTVEVVQLVTKVGSFDVDDLLLNTVGGILGFLVYRIIRGVYRKHSATDR